MKLLYKKQFILIIFLICSQIIVYSQNKTYTQFWGEVSFNGSLNKNWATEFDYKSEYSSELDQSDPFYTITERSYTGWAHYYGGARWKFSGGIGYLDNNGSSNIGSSNTPKWRFTVSTTYNIHKIGYTINTKMRIDATDEQTKGVYGIKYRYRQEFKYLQPINGQHLRKGVYYGFVSDEIFLQANSKNSGVTFFNSNRFNIGGGYLITNDLQVQASYLNEFEPKNNYDEITNVVYIQITYNNLVDKISELFKEKNKAIAKEDIEKTSN